MLTTSKKVLILHKKQTTNAMENKKIIVAFHVGRGGRFYNPGHTTFIGEMNLQELVTKRSDYLFEVNRDFLGRFCKPFLTDCSGHVVLDSDSFNDEVGALDFDGTYDTDYCRYIEDCDEDELDIIRNSGEYLSLELSEYLYGTNHPIKDVEFEL